MSVKLRKISKHKPCHTCGADLQGKWGAEIGLLIIVTLCQDCVALNRNKIFSLPSEIELLPKALTYVPLLALNKGE